MCFREWPDDPFDLVEQMQRPGGITPPVLRFRHLEQRADHVAVARVLAPARWL